MSICLKLKSTHRYSKSFAVNTKAMCTAECKITPKHTSENVKIWYFPKSPICTKIESKELSKVPIVEHK